MTSLKTLAISSVACAALLASLPGGALAAKRHSTTSHATKPKATKTHQTTVANGVRIHGVVKSLAGSSLTITLKNGTTATVTLNGSTVYYVNGAKAAARPTFTTNERVHVLAQKQSDGSYVALAVAVGHGAKHARNGGLVAGTVKSFAAGSLTILRKDGSTVTVTLNGQTKYVVNGAVAAAPPAFSNGEAVRVRVQKQADGSLVALAVATGTFTKPVHTGARIGGTVSGSTATSLTVTLKNGSSVTVTLNGNTKYIVNGAQNASPPAFSKGQQVRVLAQKQSDGSYLALVVSVRTS